MKVIIKGEFFFTDNEICLVRALQQKGIDVKYYIPVEKGRLKAALFDIKKQYPKTGIFPASIYKEFEKYSSYIDLNSVFVINRLHKDRHPSSVWLYLKLLYIFWKEKADVLHITWPQFGLYKILYLLKTKKTLTVHDPIPHSGADNKLNENNRQLAFKKCNSFVLLSNSQKELFQSKYNIPSSNIFVSKLGVFDYLDTLQYEPASIAEKYILFFGQIASYKGLEYLLPAMEIVHQKHPDVKLVVAGGGKMYFDISQYKNLPYIDIRNNYIPMPQLVGLLKGCLFAVAPYKDATQSGLLYNAFSLNIPMVVTNVGAFPEMVKDGLTGLIVPPCNSKELADAIIKLLDDESMVDTMSENIKKMWRPNMEWSEIANVFIHSYKCKSRKL